MTDDMCLVESTSYAHFNHMGESCRNTVGPCLKEINIRRVDDRITFGRTIFTNQLTRTLQPSKYTPLIDHYGTQA